MATHPVRSMIWALRRPSGGLGGQVNGVEIDWEPGDQPIQMDERLRHWWNAIERHMKVASKGA